MTAPTAAVSPSGTTISTRIPSIGDSSSELTLSVSISTSGSPFRTFSPAFLSQRETVPSTRVSASLGSLKSTSTANCGSIDLMSRCVAALAIALVLGGCAFPGTAQARTFGTGFAAGQTLRYKSHTTVSGLIFFGSQQVPISSDQELTESVKVESVDSSGTATVTITDADIVGNPVSGATPSPATLKIGRDGRIQAGAATQLAGKVPNLPGPDQLTPILPDHAVKLGESWDKHYKRPNPFGSGPAFDLSTHNSYVRDEAVGGHDAAVIDTRVRGTIDFTIDFPVSTVPGEAPSTTPTHYTGSVSSSNRYWLDLAGSQVLRSTATATYNLAYTIAPASNQAGGPLVLNFKGQIEFDRTRI